MKSSACRSLRKAAMLLFYVLPKISVTERGPTRCVTVHQDPKIRGPMPPTLPIVLLIRLDVVGS